jgi:hypothetical protein
VESQDKGHKTHYYQIKIADHLDKSWSAWLNCTTITCEANENTRATVTILTCPITDQPALRGLLNKLFDLNLTLLSVIRLESNADAHALRGTRE